MIIKIIIFSFLSILYSQPLKDFKGEIKYYGEHFLHSWVGISSSIKGNFNYDEQKGTASARLVVPLSSFDSKVPSRDSNMLIYTNAIDYPDVTFELSNIEPTPACPVPSYRIPLADSVNLLFAVSIFSFSSSGFGF